MSNKSEGSKDVSYASVDEFVGNGLKVLMESVNISNSLPTDQWKFYQTHESFNKIMNNESDKLLTLMNRILKSQNVNSNLRTLDQQQKLETIIEANDNILEIVAADLDKMNGITKNEPNSVEIQSVSAQLPVNGSWNRLDKATYSVSSSINTGVGEKGNALKSIRLLTAKNVIRPQVNFKDKIDNSNRPWIPRIKEKPNSLKPLALLPEESDFGESYAHPYEFELEKFTPPVEQLQKVTPVFPKLLTDTPLIEVTTEEQLNDLLKELLKQTQFAIDLEHHSYRTFMGITCLMQISTHEADYIIDTLELRDKLHILNEAFTKPSIVKVFHGADSDIEWLQRDLSLYVVNMFDTHQAAKQLQFPKLSLAYLMQRYCQVTPNKYFQLADWRIRPLPEELKTYARMDTHYLLYIYQMLKNELLELGNRNDNILKSIIQQSTQICSKVYMKPLLNDESHLHLYHKSKRMFDNKQMYAYKKLYHWRDTISRTEDESTGYVLPNHMLLHISESLPREMQGILSCCNPIPPLVQTYLLELHQIILQAREQSIVKPILKEDNRSRGSTLQFTKVNMDSPLHCVHDLSNFEVRDDLPTLLGSKLNESNSNVTSLINKPCGMNKIEKTTSMYSVFNNPENSDDEIGNEGSMVISGVKFLAPYERYKLVRPFVEAQEKAAEEKLDADGGDAPQTDEDRIANLHAHFVQVSKETPQIIPNKTFDQNISEDSISFNESKKRPRSSDVKDEANTGEILSLMGGSKKMRHWNKQRGATDNNEGESNLRTPRKRNRNKKSRNNSQQNTGSPQCNNKQRNQSFPHNKEQHNNRPYTEETFNNQQFNNQQFNNQQFNNQQFNNQQFNNRNRQQFNNREQHQNNAEELNNLKQLASTYDQNMRDFEKQKGFPYQDNATDERPYKRTKFNNFNRSQDSNVFTPYDYSAVDFQQFQGGAHSSKSNRNNFKSQFRPKNKNKKFNSNFNKSSTYRRSN